MRISVLLIGKIFLSSCFHTSFSSFELGCKSNQTLRIYQMFGAFLIKIASLVHLIMLGWQCLFIGLSPYLCFLIVLQMEVDNCFNTL